MLGLEFVVRSQMMGATQIPCNQAQILTSCIRWKPKCSRPAPTLGYMVAFRSRVASFGWGPKCSRPAPTLGYMVVVVCVLLRVLRLIAPAFDWWHGGHLGSSATNQIDL